MLAELERTGENQISLTDPDSRAMAAHTRVAVGYNVQVAVDAKHKLIVEQQVTNQVVDHGSADRDRLPGKGDPRGRADRTSWPTVATSRSRTSRPARRAGIDPLCAAPAARSLGQGRPVPQGRVPIRGRDRQYVCPAGQRLQPYTSSLLRGLKKINYANRLSARTARLRSRCTRQPVSLGVAAGERGRAGPDGCPLARHPDILKQRRETVEHPFGSIKQWMYQGAFLMRRLRKVRAEFSLTALAYNLRRVLNIVEFAELMAAVQG